MTRANVFQAIASLRDRVDEAATRELVDLFESRDDGVRLEAARVLFGRALPPDLRERVAAPILGSDLDSAESMVRWPLRCAASALLDQPAAKAFAETEPLLRGTATWRPFDRLRAEVVLSALEDQLAHCSTLHCAELQRVMPDDRFRSVCAEIQSTDESLRFLATLVVDGFRYFAGEDVEPTARRVDLGEGDDAPFPFIVAGFSIETRAKRDEIEARLDDLAQGRPPGLSWFEHQYGGLSCLSATLLGYGVAVPNDPPTLTTIAELARVWSDTSGEPMTPPDLLEWGQRLHALLPPEGAAMGAEALLVSQPCTPIETLADMEVLGFGATRAPWRRYIDVGFDPDVTRGGRYGAAHDRLPAHLGDALGLGRPRIAHLWGNSD